MKKRLLVMVVVAVLTVAVTVPAAALWGKGDTLPGPGVIHRPAIIIDVPGSGITQKGIVTDVSGAGLIIDVPGSGIKLSAPMFGDLGK